MRVDLNLEHLECVGRVVVPLPGARHERDGHILQREHPCGEHADQVEVTLDQIRILVLAEKVVVQLVVLHVPGLHQHPVEPVDAASVEAANSEGEAVVPPICVKPIEAAVSDLVQYGGST